MINLKWRAADEVIGEDYLSRWFLLRQPGKRNVYIHKYLGSDDDRALHDHPWRSWSILFWGRLEEHTPEGVKRVWPLIPKYRSAHYTHRVVLKSKVAFTLFMTGRKRREWGFHCPTGWVHWTEFTDESGTKKGAGCPE